MDTLVVPFIFVPHGEPVPTDWLARHSDPIRVPARFLPRRPNSNATTAQTQFEADFDPAGPSTSSGDEGAHLATFETAEPEHRSTWAEPDPVTPLQEDPVAAYMRIEDFLDRLGLGDSARANQSLIFEAAEMLPGEPDRTRPAADDSPRRGSLPASPQIVTPGGDPNGPVPLVDDQGHPVLNREGKPILRPASLDPHMFVRQGLKDRRLMEELIPLGDEGAASAAAHETMVLSRFACYTPWDAQRLDWGWHPEFRDYATVVIELYAAAAGFSDQEILKIENLAAAVISKFAKREGRDPTYKSLPPGNVSNTEIGRDLFLSGRIGEGRR